MTLVVETVCDFCTRYEDRKYSYHHHNICDLCYKLYVQDFFDIDEVKSDSSVSNDSDSSIESVEIK